MKHYKPGQIMNVNGNMYRAKRRTCGCQGCVLNNVFICPMIKDKRFNGPDFDCAIDDIILINTI